MKEFALLLMWIVAVYFVFSFVMFLMNAKNNKLEESFDEAKRRNFD